MSGLALVARRWERRSPAPTAPTRPTASGCGRRHRAPHRARRRQPAGRARRWWSPRRSPRTTPSWRRRASADSERLHRGDLLGEVSRLKRTIAVAGTHGKTTTASMAAHVPCSSAAAARLPHRRRAARGRHERRLGGGGVGGGRGRRVRPLVPEARARRGGGHQRRARPPRHLPLARRARPRRSRSSPSLRACVCSARGSTCPAQRPAGELRDRGRRPARRAGRAAAARLALQGRGRGGGAARCRGATTC